MRPKRVERRSSYLPTTKTRNVRIPRIGIGKYRPKAIGWSLLIPVYHEDQLVNPKHKWGILDLKLCRGLRRRNFKLLGVDLQPIYSRQLTANFGLSKAMADVLSTRPLSQIQRIQEQMEAIIDPLVLVFPQHFTEGSELRKILKKVLRSVMSEGAFNLDQTTKYWKEVAAYAYVVGARLEVEQQPVISQKNIFKRLLKSQLVTNWLKGDDRRFLIDLAHFTSTRHLVSGGKQAQVKTLKTFKETTSKPFLVDQGDLERLRHAVTRIVTKCNMLGNRKGFNFKKGHISLTYSASLNATQREGGRGTEIANLAKKFLTEVLDYDERINLPFVTLVTGKGEQRWATWCRETPLYQLEFLQEVVLNPPPDFPNKAFKPFPAFGDLRSDITLLGRYNYYWGYDECLGNQIYCMAYLEYLATNDDPFPTVRVSTIPEPGGKFRTVTVSDWWVNVLMQPFCHIVKGILELHPSAVAGLRKADQAWQYLVRLSKASFETLDEVVCLSSDLKEATDAMPPEVAQVLLEGFNFFFPNQFNEAYRAAIKVATCQKIIIMPDNTCFIKRRGILMGEPLTKVALATLNLAVEELALIDYLNLNWWDFNAPSPLWRCYAVGGDDHIAVGPRDYLSMITANHRKFGSMISPEKHGVSMFAVKYCEKMLFVQHFKEQIDPKDPLVGEKHPFIDSIKVRLLSRSTKSLEVLGERNTAIGKGAALGSTIAWLNRDHFSIKWCKMVRERFEYRMKEFLPRFKKLKGYLYLPASLGGLNLLLREEYDTLTLPNLILSLLVRLASEPYDYKIHDALKSFRRNYSSRGDAMSEELRQSCLQFFHEFSEERLPFKSLNDRFRSILKDSDSTGKIRILEGLGWIGIDSFLDRIDRVEQFRTILDLKGPKKLYNTTPWRERYHILWTALKDQRLSDEELQNYYIPHIIECVDKKLRTLPFVNLYEEHKVEYLDAKNELIKISSTFGEEIYGGTPLLNVDIYQDLIDEDN